MPLRNSFFIHNRMSGSQYDLGFLDIYTEPFFSLSKAMNQVVPAGSGYSPPALQYRQQNVSLQFSFTIFITFSHPSKPCVNIN